MLERLTCVVSSCCREAREAAEREAEQQVQRLPTGEPRIPPTPPCSALVPAPGVPPASPVCHRVCLRTPRMPSASLHAPLHTAEDAASRPGTAASMRSSAEVCAPPQIPTRWHRVPQQASQRASCFEFLVRIRQAHSRIVRPHCPRPQMGSLLRTLMDLHDV